jgi:hypothetical protein
LRVARLMSLTTFSPGLFVVFLIVHSSVVTMSKIGQDKDVSFSTITQVRFT